MNLRTVTSCCTLLPFLPQMKGHFQGLAGKPAQPFFYPFNRQPPDFPHHAYPLDQPPIACGHQYPSHRMEPRRHWRIPWHALECLGLQPVFRPAGRHAFDWPAGGQCGSAVCRVFRGAGATLVDYGRLPLCNPGVIGGGALLWAQSGQRLPGGRPGADCHVPVALPAPARRGAGLAGGPGRSGQRQPGLGPAGAGNARGGVHAGGSTGL